MTKISACHLQNGCRKVEGVHLCWTAGIGITQQLLSQLHSSSTVHAHLGWDCFFKECSRLINELSPYVPCP